MHHCTLVTRVPPRPCQDNARLVICQLFKLRTTSQPSLLYTKHCEPSRSRWSLICVIVGAAEEKCRLSQDIVTSVRPTTTTGLVEWLKYRSLGPFKALNRFSRADQHSRQWINAMMLCHRTASMYTLIILAMLVMLGSVQQVLRQQILAVTNRHRRW